MSHESSEILENQHLRVKQYANIKDNIINTMLIKKSLNSFVE